MGFELPFRSSIATVIVHLRFLLFLFLYILSTLITVQELVRGLFIVTSLR